MPAIWKQYEPEQATYGVARLALTDVVETTDPANEGDIMDPTTWDYVDPFVDQGGTEGGVTMTKSFAEQTFKLDQSDSPFDSQITGHTMKIATTLGQSGDLEKFDDAWLADPTTTTVAAVVGPPAIPAGRLKGIAAVRVVPHKSLVVSEIDKRSKTRHFYFRDVAREAGDSAYALSPTALHTLPISWTAYPDQTQNGKEFGFILEEVGFGGIS